MVELRNPVMVMNISERRTRKERGRIRRVLVMPCLGGAYRGERDDGAIATVMEHARDSEDVWHAKQEKWCERCTGE
jgi:predicted NUDIX family NTP pyrophosphohydrolase